MDEWMNGWMDGGGREEAGLAFASRYIEEADSLAAVESVFLLVLLSQSLFVVVCDRRVALGSHI